MQNRPENPKGKVVAIIPSAGLGRRMGGRKKNYLLLSGSLVLAYTLAAFETSTLVDAIVIAVAPGDEEYCRGSLAPFDFRKVSHIVAGGRERQDSVWNALEFAKDAEVVAVHDGARPLVTVEIIDAVIRSAFETGAAIAAVPVKDTIKEVSDGMVARTIDRTRLVSVQTPQAFRREILVNAFRKAKADNFYGTDESSLVERAGHTVSVVRGSYENFKITTAEDLLFAEGVLGKRGAPLSKPPLP
ncbi:MAG: 2-C-methyl-D-erythritol 4-phosphate cytidylyltransferase [Deltaproteobacteria bacterium]|nr:2-C-methyl-D-erythritol 4-phosphate cytidylyltransferase [Deltaproteobacteria bacterium]